MSDRLKKVIRLVLAAVLLAGVAPIQRALNRDREALGLTRQTPLENAPPMLAFTTVALGGFRGLIANALWIRASELQDADKYFEMQQLASWITKLEPHFTHVWIVQAWNMSYNISVKFKENGPGDYSDRWRWVRAGITLLRDEGLRYNPHDVMIHRELAWHFQHKMGANLDDANMFYKNMWALEMARVFTGKTPDLNPLINPTTEEDLRRLNILTNEFKMDPAFMKHVDESYGPLEWRLPEAHAIYWAAKGLAMAAQYPQKVNQEDLIQLSRVIYQSMQMSFRRGRLMSDPVAEGIEIGPNLAIIPTVNKAYEEAAKERDAQYTGNIEGAHRNFLRDAVIFLYSSGREADAASWYAYIREKYPNKPVIENDAASLPGITPLRDFVLAQIGIDVTETDRDKVKARIEEFLGTAYISLIRGNHELYAGYRLMARAVRDRFMQSIGQDAASQARIGQRPIEEIEQEVLKRLLDANDPVYGLPPEARAILRSELRMAPETVTGTNAPAGPINSSPATNTIPVRTNAVVAPTNSPAPQPR